jgi:hypothetical protein
MARALTSTDGAVLALARDSSFDDVEDVDAYFAALEKILDKISTSKFPIPNDFPIDDPELESQVADEMVRTCEFDADGWDDESNQPEHVSYRFTISPEEALARVLAARRERELIFGSTVSVKSRLLAVRRYCSPARRGPRRRRTLRAVPRRARAPGRRKASDPPLADRRRA